MSESLAMIDVVGFWLGIFLTFCILSFLYKDNPFYKFAEHLFIGVSIGYVVTQQYYNVLRPKLINRMGDAEHWWWNWDVFALILVLLMFVKVLSTKLGWLGRYPLAFVVALYAGLQINGVAQADLGQQIKYATKSIDSQKLNINNKCPGIEGIEGREGEGVDVAPDVSACRDGLRKGLIALPGISASLAKKIQLRAEVRPFESLDEITELNLTKAEGDGFSENRGSVVGVDAKAATKDGQRDLFNIFSQLLLLIGLLASLVYFYFSVEHKGVIGKVSKFGVWVLMIGFGASFGLTVQGRIALAIGRVQDIAGTNLTTEKADQIHGPLVALVSIAVIIAGLVIWELKEKRKNGGSGGSGGGGGRRQHDPDGVYGYQETTAGDMPHSE